MRGGMPLARGSFWPLIPRVSDSYRSGAHDPWTHCVCGFVAGGLLGTLLGSEWFESGRGILASTIVGAAITAYAAGMKGDEAWEWIVEIIAWVL